MSVQRYRVRQELSPAGVVLIWSAGACLFLMESTASAGPVFTGLGYLPDGGLRSAAMAVSADGTTIVGQADGGFGENAAFLWTLSEGMVGLGSIPGRGIFISANGVSADGSVIVGGVRGGAPGVGSAAIWRAGSAPVLLGSTAGGFVPGVGRSVSADGSVVVGSGWQPIGNIGREEAFLWTESTGVRPLGVLGESEFARSFVSDITADGSTVVGSSGADFQFQGFVWTESTGMTELNLGEFTSVGGITADGEYIIGITSGAGAFRWSAEEGLLPLGNFGPRAIAGDGAIVVGTGGDFGEFGETFAVIWNSTRGVRLLREVLEVDYGLDLSGWILQEANDISIDGTVIVGTGINPLGQTEAYVAFIPEPATMLLFAVALTAFSCCRWKQVMARVPRPSAAPPCCAAPEASQRAS